MISPHFRATPMMTGWDHLEAEDYKETVVLLKPEYAARSLDGDLTNIGIANLCLLDRTTAQDVFRERKERPS